MKFKKDDMIRLYTNMVRGRTLDEICRKALAEGRLQWLWHSAEGSEAVGAGTCTFLRCDDWLLCSVRGHGSVQLISKGFSPKIFLAESCQKATGCCGGRSVNRLWDLSLGIPGTSGTIGGNFPVAAGLGIAAKTKGKGQVVVCIFGDGAAQRGTLHESFNLAAIWKLPIIWVCENNNYSIFSPLEESFAGKDIAALAVPYSMPGVIVDGQDVLAVHEATQNAVEKARAGEGPSLVECKTLRFRPHHEGRTYLRRTRPVSEEELQEIRRRDPIRLFQERLLAQGILTQDDVDRIDKEAVVEMEEAERFANESPPARVEDIWKGLYADEEGGQ